MVQEPWRPGFASTPSEAPLLQSVSSPSRTESGRVTQRCLARRASIWCLGFQSSTATPTSAGWHGICIESLFTLSVPGFTTDAACAALPRESPPCGKSLSLGSDCPLACDALAAAAAGQRSVRTFFYYHLRPKTGRKTRKGETAHRPNPGNAAILGSHGTVLPRLQANRSVVFNFIQCGLQ